MLSFKNINDNPELLMNIYFLSFLQPLLNVFLFMKLLFEGIFTCTFCHVIMNIGAIFKCNGLEIISNFAMSEERPA